MTTMAPGEAATKMTTPPPGEVARWGSSRSSRESRRPRRDPVIRVLGRWDTTIGQSSCMMFAAGTGCSRVQQAVEAAAVAAVAMARVAAAAVEVAVAKATDLAAVAVSWVQWEAAAVAVVVVARTTADLMYQWGPSAECQWLRPRRATTQP